MSQTEADSFDRSKTLEELENDRWGEPVYSSHLVTETYRLRTVPLEQFTIENLRIMIGQQRGLRYLVPMALEKLDADPWISGDLYRGDLLQSVLRAPPEFWATRDDLVSGLHSIFSDLEIGLELLQKELLPAWSQLLRALYNADPP